MHHVSEYTRKLHRDRRKICESECAIIEGEKKKQGRQSKGVRVKQRYPTRWRAGICTICGEFSLFVSNEHARRHGYKSGDEMARAGVIRWME